MNQPIDPASMETFLSRLGKCYRHQGDLYLVGGSSLILVAAKESTLDIDVQFDIPPEHHSEFIQCLRRISRELAVPVEQASPEQFIPLPAGFKERRSFIGRYGSLDVFHFDFYSIALSKLHRGSEKDLADVTGMIEQEIINLQMLETYYQEILPQFDFYKLETDTEGFKRGFELLKQRLNEQQLISIHQETKNES